MNTWSNRLMMASLTGLVGSPGFLMHSGHTLSFIKERLENYKEIIIMIYYCYYYNYETKPKPKPKPTP